MVANGGYGAVQKCLIQGVPMVLSGVGQDKAVVGAIADFTGVAINLAAKSPGAERIGAAVKTILADKSYRIKAEEFSRIYNRYDMKKELADVVQDVVNEWLKNKKSVADEL